MKNSTYNKNRVEREIVENSKIIEGTTFEHDGGVFKIQKEETAQFDGESINNVVAKRVADEKTINLGENYEDDWNMSQFIIEKIEGDSTHKTIGMLGYLNFYREGIVKDEELPENEDIVRLFKEYRIIANPREFDMYPLVKAWIKESLKGAIDRKKLLKEEYNRGDIDLNIYQNARDIISRTIEAMSLFLEDKLNIEGE